MKISKMLMLLTASTLAFGAAAPALAQSAAADQGASLGEVVVTARRSEEKLQNVPISITVYSQKQLSRLNIVNPADLGTYTPSLTTNNKSGPDKASFVIRGFVQDSQTQPSVGVYFNDVVGPRGSGLTTSGNGVGIGNLFDLQNVQVLKGPQGTLFGRNTTGGAVLLVPQKPTDSYGGYIEGSAGNYGMKRIQAVVNVPVSEKLKIRAGVDHMDRDGYLENYSGIGPDRLADVGFTSGRISIVANPSNTVENYLVASYSDVKNHGIVPRLVGCNPASPFASLCNGQISRQTARGAGWWDVDNTEPDPLIHDKTWQVINTTTWEASENLTVKNIASYGEFHERARYSLLGDDFRLPSGALALTAIRTNDNPGHDFTSQSTYTEEIQFQGKALDGKVSWQAGGYLENSEPVGFSSQASPLLINCPQAYSTLSAGNVQCPASATGSISIPYYQTTYRDRGIYAQTTYNFTDQWALTTGLRYTWDKVNSRYDGTTVRFPTSTTSVYSCSNGVRVTNPDGSSPVLISGLQDHGRCAVFAATSSHKPTWLIDLDYKPTSDTLLYAKWARGYRAGSANAANILFETFQPEKVDDYEVGAKQSFRTDDISGYLDFAAFYNNFENQQLQATQIRNPRPGNPFVGGVVEVNAGKSQIWGFEVDATAVIKRQLTLNIGYTYLNTKLLEITNPVVPAAALPYFTSIQPNSAAGLQLPLSPKNRVIVSAIYTLPISEDIGKISFGPTFVHSDRQLVSVSTAPQFQYIPPINLLSISANWEHVMGSPTDISFFMTNATNAAYPITTSTSYSSFGIESQIPNEPRMWGFRVRYTFGS